MTDGLVAAQRLIQPQVDAVMYHGLQRFRRSAALLPRSGSLQTGDSVTLNLKGPDGERGDGARGLAGGSATAAPALFVVR